MTQEYLVTQYLNLVAKTEPPWVFHRWSFLTVSAANLGRHVWLPFGASRVFPNMYVMLLGDPGTRKSSAIKFAARTLEESGYNYFSSERSSKEKFLMDLEAGVFCDGGSREVTAESVWEVIATDDEDFKQVMVAADEFNDFIGAGNLDFMSLLGSLWDWDKPSKPYQSRLKNSKSLAIRQPTISILGGNTHTNFSLCFPPESMGQGFLSRMLLIGSEASKRRYSIPGEPDPVLWQRIKDGLAKARTELRGPMTLAADAREIIDDLYYNPISLHDSRFVNYETRRQQHLLKLCINLAASRMSMKIDANDVVYANTILRFAEINMPKALGEFGKAKHAEVANRIVSFVARQKGCKEATIWMNFSSDFDRPAELHQILQNLVAAGKIQLAPVSGGAPQYLPIKPIADASERWTNWDMLREHKEV